VWSQLYKVNTVQHFTCILHLLNNTCVKHNFKSIQVSNLFWSREYNSAKEICKYPSFSKVGGNYPLDLKIIWSSALRYMWDCPTLHWDTWEIVLHYIEIHVRLSYITLRYMYYFALRRNKLKEKNAALHFTVTDGQYSLLLSIRVTSEHPVIYSQTCVMWPCKGTVKYGHISFM
jgi:hypothetical protein